MNWTHNPTYVNLPYRLIAHLIDRILFAIVMFFPVTILANVTDIVQLAPTFMLLLGAIWLPEIILIPLGYCLLLSKWGFSPGKYVCGIRLADKTGNLLSFKRVLFRELIAKQISAVVLMLGFLKIATDPNHQAWHDTLSDSYAYKTNAQSYLGILVLLLLLFIQLYLSRSVVVTISSNTSLIADIKFLFTPLLDLLK